MIISRSMLPKIVSVILAATIPSLIAEPATDGPDDARQVCIVQDPLIQEASGIAISRTTKNAVWMHNDSGDKARLFLVDLNGMTRAIVNLTGVTATDWEDMCSFEMDGENWLLIGDIGDNGKVRGRKSPSCQLLLMKEPSPLDPMGSHVMVESSATVTRTVTFDFPDGPHDCESLAVDTVTRQILLLTKTDPFHSALYSLPLKLSSGSENLTAEKIASLGVPFATAMDVSSDGRHLVVADMFSGAMISRMDPKSESWTDACKNSVTALTLPKRKQGESICFTIDGNAMLLNSEGVSQPLWQVKNPYAQSQ